MDKMGEFPAKQQLNKLDNISPKYLSNPKPSKVRSNLGRNLFIKSLKELFEQFFFNLAKALY